MKRKTKLYRPTDDNMERELEGLTHVIDAGHKATLKVKKKMTQRRQRQIYQMMNEDRRASWLDN